MLNAFRLAAPMTAAAIACRLPPPASAARKIVRRRRGGYGRGAPGVRPDAKRRPPPPGRWAIGG